MEVRIAHVGRVALGGGNEETKKTRLKDAIQHHARITVSITRRGLA